MPTYDYECESCGHEFEMFQSIKAEHLTDCPECNKSTLIRLIGAGGAVIIRGTKNPCTGGRSQKRQTPPKRAPRDKLGQGKNKGENPFWRPTGKVNKKILKNPERYIKEGKVD